MDTNSHDGRKRMKFTAEMELICHCGLVMWLCPECLTEYCLDPGHGACRCPKEEEWGNWPPPPEEETPDYYLP
jgi:hypothetical protein